MHTRNGNGSVPRIVAIGGGSGSSNLLGGLKLFGVELTVIVTMFDSGGSSGLLRKEFGYPPFGDLRQCLLALSEDTPETRALRNALEFRFGRDTSLNGHTVGNLLLAALTTVNNDLERAIQEISQVLRVTGQVIPVTLDRAELCAELEDGGIIQGESDIDLRAKPSPRIRKIFLAPRVKANPRAIQAILDADAIVLGPGDLYTSILPNLLPDGIVDAIAASPATRVYVCNLMTKLGETDGFKASDFVSEVARYLAPARLHWAVVNTSVPSQAVLAAYEAEGAYPVRPDVDAVSAHVSGIVAARLAASELPLRHDSRRTAEAILQSISAGRMSDRVEVSARPLSV